MKIINSGTPLTGNLDLADDWLLRSPLAAIFPNAGFGDGFIVAKFDLPTAISVLSVVSGASAISWHLPAQLVSDNFPTLNYSGEQETITTTLPESVTTSQGSETEGRSQTRRQDTSESEETAGAENETRNQTSNGTRNQTTSGSNTGSNSVPYVRTTVLNRVVEPDSTIQCCSNGFAIRKNEVTNSTETETFTPNASAQESTSGTLNETTTESIVESTSGSSSEQRSQSGELSESSNESGTVSRQNVETRTGGTQITFTERGIPSQVRYGFRIPRISYDPNTISVNFSYRPTAEVRLTDVTGKIGISCMYSLDVEASGVQAIAPGDRSSPVRLPDAINFKVTAYMAIRTETNFGNFGSAREESRKISLRQIAAKSNQNTLLERKLSNGEPPIANLANPSQLGVVTASYVLDLAEKLKTSNFNFPLLNPAYLLINKKGRQLEYMINSQVLTWDDASIAKKFNVSAVGPSPTITQSAVPRKSLIFA